MSRARKRFAPARESIDVTQTLVLHWLSNPERCQSCDLEDYIERSEDSRAYFDALLYLVAAIRFRGEQLPVPLFFWWLGLCRRAPATSPTEAFPGPSPGQFGQPPCVTSRFNSPSRSFAESEWRRKAKISPAAKSSRRR